MSPDKSSVDCFLKDVLMHSASIDLEAVVDHMLEEMDHGLNGKASSLPMIPTYIQVDSDVAPNRPIAVLDAGGTNLRAALLRFSSEAKPLIESFSKQAMPGTRGRIVGREEFFDTIAALVQPLLNRSDKIGFCFSYHVEMNRDGDGRLIRFSKEVQAPEVAGRLIGADLKDALHNRGVLNLPDIVILNDTAATLLTGKVANTHRNWGGFVGFILGTGTNTSYVEFNRAIGKLSDLDSSGTQIINCETGNYACQNRGKGDKILGQQTLHPHTYWLEKMLSGAYFGLLSKHTIALACEAGLFSPAIVKTLDNLKKVATKDADNYCHNPSDVSDNSLAAAMMDKGNEADSRRLWFLIDDLLERAAKLSAANLAASVIKGRSKNGPMNPTCLSIDGTAYYRYYRFQNRVEHYLRPFLAQRDKYYETVRVEDAPLIGAAVAALTN